LPSHNKSGFSDFLTILTTGSIFPAYLGPIIIYSTFAGLEIKEVTGITLGPIRVISPMELDYLSDSLGQSDYFQAAKRGHPYL